MRHRFLRAWLLAALFSVFSLAVTRAQAPAWQSAVSIPVSASREAYILSAVVDAGGNVYVAGAFYGTAAFGSINLTSAGGEDGFVAKWSPAANDFVWAQRIGGANDERAYAVAVGSVGVYVTGYFRSQPAAFGALSLTSAGVEDLFIAKLTDTGTSASFTWAQRVGGSQFEGGRALAVSGTSVYVGGYYSDATFGATVLPTGSPANLFVAKLVDAGPAASFVWAKGAGGFTGYNAVNALAVSGNNVYLSGFFSGTATFGAATLTSAGSYDAVVAKLADAGATADFVWAQRAGGSGADQARAVAVSGSNVYMAGDFTGSAASFGAATLASAGLNDAFVSKLTDAGATAGFGWSQRFGGTGEDEANGLVAAGAQVCAVGEFRSPSLAFGQTTLSNAGGYDIFAAKLTDAGAAPVLAWAQRAGGVNSDFGYSAALGAGGQVYFGGLVQPPGGFGIIPVAGLPGSTVGTFAVLTDATLTATAPALTVASLALFPNPAHGRATVQLPALPGTPTATLTVLDALGRTLRTQTAAANSKAALDLTGLAPGLYAVRVTAGATTATHRLVVE